MPPILVALGLFLVGVVLAVWATGRLLTGLVQLARLTALSTFAVGAVLSGFEAENVAVGLAAALGGGAPIALGTVFGGATFLVGVALGLGALIYPMRIRLPPGFLVVLALTPLLPGLVILGDRTSRLAGLVLLVAFTAAMAYLVLASRGQSFLESDEVEEALEARADWPRALGTTALGLVAIGLGGELVASGAERIVATLGVPALLMGMVVTPAATTREGHPEVSAGNLVGTALYFLLFNLGLIALAAPVRVDPTVRTLDWPFLVAITWLATLFLARGKVGRVEGAVLLLAYAVYVALHVV